MHRLPVIAFALTALVASSGAAQQAPGGSVAGQVTVTAEPSAPPASLSPYARRRYSPPQSPGVAGGEEDAFVYLEPMSGDAPLSISVPARILQRERTIIPHASVVQVGQVVEFPNEDDVYHNLFSLSAGNRFSLGRYAPGVTETNQFRSPGVVHLFCDIHAEMAGVILVVSTRYVARVQPGGRYRLSDVPAGAYRAIAWHPTAGADTVAVTVRGAQEVSQDYSLRPGP
jgi:plastocyanin